MKYTNNTIIFLTIIQIILHYFSGKWLLLTNNIKGNCCGKFITPA
uniref:7TM_GPCR_Srx domain-containing protein n=1 Tax=Brugia timori TaxID=42155 RepID=A0A0R3QD59_9BILA